LLEPTGSPLVLDLLRRIQARYPAARFTFYAPLRTGHAEDGGRAAFGVPIQPQYDFRRATVVLAINADFLSAMPFHLRYARDFAERRRPSAPSDEMNRLYAAETMLTPTGAMADHRLRRKPSEMGALLAAVAAELAALPGSRVPASLRPLFAPFAADRDRAAIAAIARDLARRPEQSVIVVGASEAPETHALAFFLNVALGSAAFHAIAPTLGSSDLATQSLPDLASDIKANHVDTLVVLGGNPVYTSPADLALDRLLPSVRERIYLGAHENETALFATWYLPAAHYLESWGDARAYDGTLSLVQPLIDPLFGGRTNAELLAVFLGDRTPDGRALLWDYWNQTGGATATAYGEALRQGLFADSAAPRLELAADAERIAHAVDGLRLRRQEQTTAPELAFAVDPAVYDGRFANNPWLQELPKPITKLTWDNALYLSAATAEKLDLRDGDVVEVKRQDRSLRLPALVVPGHADDAFTASLGFGRRGAEAIARDVGADLYALRTTDAAWFAADVSVRKLAGLHHALARNQQHFSTEERPIALFATLAEWRAHPDFTAEERGPVLALYAPPAADSGPQWAMTIDNSLCTGCGSCIVGCQAENNILVVGKPGVLNKREMHWLRIDTYFAGPRDAPQVLHEPMLCQHCEKAPCEYVCPVNATVHSPDGLNEMVYNRCVGTRFCSNNCPYKVRRFNWFDWIDHQPANQGLVRLQRNPNVTVRDRGVMEKCTYCVQRIRSTEIEASNARRAVAPGEVQTACQQACPTRAIQFDSLTHTDTLMVKWRRESRAFSVLHELGTQPRTQYLARISNPNPELGE
jgi:molybdopterin-containing oxidoreductase family iron-sulfur binding subunit